MTRESTEGAAGFATKLGRRQTSGPAKPCAEGAEAFIADCQANLSDIVIASEEQLAGFLNPSMRQELMRCLAKGAGEHSLKVEGRQAGFPGRFFERDTAIIVSGDIIAGAAEAGKGSRIGRPPPLSAP
jgi:hypothetical protein